ncbi:MAG: alpha/beta hydrolase [Verrucomicrobiota bacterium]
MQLEPEHRNVVYGPHERQRYDVYRADGMGRVPAYVSFHGGGYRGGDKTGIFHRLAARLALEGIAFVSVNYRFSKDAEYLAPLKDAARAVQHLRQHAADFGIDPMRIAVGGGSAGAASACWLALGVDHAVADSPDPVARQSTRPVCVMGFQAQTTLDPRFIRRLIPGLTWTLPALQELTRLTPEEYDLPENAQRMDELSFLEQAGAGAPPFFLWNVTPDHPLTEDLDMNTGIHHPVFGRTLKARLDAFGVECVLRRREDHPLLEGRELENRMLDEAGDFLVRHLNG